MNDERVQMHVDADRCIAGGQCELLHPDVFECDDDTAIASVIGDGTLPAPEAEAIIDRCPSGAISVVMSDAGPPSAPANDASASAEEE